MAHLVTLRMHAVWCKARLLSQRAKHESPLRCQVATCACALCSLQGAEATAKHGRRKAQRGSHAFEQWSS